MKKPLYLLLSLAVVCAVAGVIVWFNRPYENPRHAWVQPQPAPGETFPVRIGGMFFDSDDNLTNFEKARQLIVQNRDQKEHQELGKKNPGVVPAATRAQSESNDEKEYQSLRQNSSGSTILPSGTKAVLILKLDNHYKVNIVDGPMKGRTGWISFSDAMPRLD